MDTIFLLSNNEIEPFLGWVQKPLKAALLWLTVEEGFVKHISSGLGA